ncbi:MAG TPA: hypothetical protein VFD75_11375 [Pyrinomonadaceae bacterium]|nr:hypothetical protein [Pyrinomonadaceae bacterium]
MKKFFGAVLVYSMLAGCSSGPGAGILRTSYPSLASSTTSYRWLVVKCQVADVSTIPAGLDMNIQQFMGIAGANYGNIVDYFHDVSYNRASVLSDTFVGWIRAPFNKADLTGLGRLASAFPGRQKRVEECLGAIPADQAPDLDDFYGVVVVNNDVQDGGACYVGQQNLTVNSKAHKLACLWFDPNSLKTEFAAHEFAHGLGMIHSYDDSARNCGGTPGEYCDPWDVMSAQGTYQFIDRNWITAGSPSGSGPGISAPGLLSMGWIPADNQRRFQFEGDQEQQFKIRALSRARPGEPLVVIVETGDPRPFEGIYTVEYRQGDGWDLGFATDINTPAKVRTSGGVVLVHQYRPVGAPTSSLVNGAFTGAMQPCDTMVLGNGARYISVKDFDTLDGTATVSIGFGSGKGTLCFRNIITRQIEPRIFHAPLPLSTQH